MNNIPLLMRVAVEDENGGVSMQTIRADQIVMNTTPFHASLPYDVRKQAQKAWQKVGRYIDSRPKDKWVDDFRFERNPMRQVQIYFLIAKAYEEFCNFYGLIPNPSEREKLLGLLLAISLGIVDVAHHGRASDELVSQLRDVWMSVCRNFD